MYTPRISFRCLFLLIITASLSACGSDAPETSDVKFSAPARILAVRAVDRTNLRPEVIIANGTSVPMERVGDNAWTGTINVPANSTQSISVIWIETMEQGDLPLATWERDVGVGAVGTTVSAGNQDYQYAVDTDGDGVSNITERENNTDPFGPNNEQASNNEDDESDANNTDPDDTQTPATDEDDDTDPDASNTDDDDDGTTTTPNPNSNQAPPTVIIPRISVGDAPSIDGEGVRTSAQGALIGEWADAVQFDTGGVGLFIDNLMIDDDAEDNDGDEYRRWAAMHDGINLYVVVLSDDVGARYDDSNNIWHDDSLEIFIDANNSKLLEWGDADDWHYLIPLLVNNGSSPNSTVIDDGPMSTGVDLDIEFFTGPGAGPDGIRLARWEQDVYELATPMAAAGIVPGRSVGLEFQLNDDDNGGNRESKWGWFHPSRQNDTDTDTSYTDPSVMGTVILE